MNDDLSLLDAIRSRRTVRNYQDNLISDDILLEILRESTHAPSACNKRGWRFIIIRNPQTLEWLYKKGSAAFVKKSKQAVLVCYSNFVDNVEWQDLIQSASAAIAYFQLLAHAQGIGSCWINHLPPKKEIKKQFKIPRNFQPIALVTCGYYKENLKLTPRKLKKEKIVSTEKWNFDKDSSLEFSYRKLYIKKLLRKIYYSLPMRELFREITHRFEKKFHNEKYENPEK